jgi:hypothetical protein
MVNDAWRVRKGSGGMSMAGNVSSVGISVSSVWKVGVVLSVGMGIGLEMIENVKNVQ